MRWFVVQNLYFNIILKIWAYLICSKNEIMSFNCMLLSMLHLLFFAPPKQGNCVVVWPSLVPCMDSLRNLMLFCSFFCILETIMAQLTKKCEFLHFYSIASYNRRNPFCLNDYITTFLKVVVTIFTIRLLEVKLVYQWV